MLRAPDGTITTIDPPGSISSSAAGINPAGAITGTFCDTVTCHGYLRTPDGTFTTFDAPGAGTGSFQGTFTLSINPAGVMAGYYTDASYVNHGFLRSP